MYNKTETQEKGTHRAFLFQIGGKVQKHGSENAVIVPPFKTQGIKTKLAAFIKENSGFTPDLIWTEPFCGSGAAGFGAGAVNAVMRDRNPYIPEFYGLLVSGEETPESVRAFLTEQGKLLSAGGKDMWYGVRERFNREHSPLDFLFLNRTCFNGVMRFSKAGNYNTPFCGNPEKMTPEYADRIAAECGDVCALFRAGHWDFGCAEFRETLALCGKENFVYADPPYIGLTGYGSAAWTEEDEKDLYSALRSSGARFAVSSWQTAGGKTNPYPDTLWADCRKYYAAHRYTVGPTADLRPSVTEVLMTGGPGISY